MLTLGVDASLPMLSVALLNDATILGAIALEGKGSRNEKLLPAIDWLLTENGTGRRAIELFAVTRGPGSFTGVRIGMATVQGMALALDRPVCSMSTHEAIALGSFHAGATTPGERTVVYDEAGRGEFYLSVFENGQEAGGPRLTSEAERDDVVRSASRAISVSDFLRQGNVAACCARRAQEVTAAGQSGLYADPTPIYVRLAEAEVKLQQKMNG
jgi:tRNA threonylcarbamoyl adenosine modification protein YeaZ